MSDEPRISPVSGSTEVVREQDKVMLVLAYVWLLCLVPLFTVKDSPFVSWHAKQGLLLAAVWLASKSLFMLGPLAWLNCLLWPAIGVCSLMGIIKALQGQRWRIPVLADLADKL